MRKFDYYGLYTEDLGSWVVDPGSRMLDGSSQRIRLHTSHARACARVYTCVRIMRACGCAHAPARGDKQYSCSRIDYSVGLFWDTACLDTGLDSCVHTWILGALYGKSGYAQRSR